MKSDKWSTIAYIIGIGAIIFMIIMVLIMVLK